MLVFNSSVSTIEGFENSNIGQNKVYLDFENKQFHGSKAAETLLDTGAGLDCISTGLLREWGVEYDSNGKKIQLAAFDGKRSETVG